MYFKSWRHVAYRRKVQGYSGEEKKMSENIHLGLVAGTNEFAKHIKKKYMPENPNEEIPPISPNLDKPEPKERRMRGFHGKMG